MRSEPRANLETKLTRGGLREKATIDRERVGAGPIHVRIDAVAAVPPHEILAGERHRGPLGAEPLAQPLRHLPGQRHFAQTDIVSLVKMREDARPLIDRIRLEGPLATRAKGGEILVRSPLPDAIGAITIVEPCPPLHAHQAVQRERLVAQCLRVRAVEGRQRRTKIFRSR